MTRTWDAEGVRRLRERLGVTQAELADRIGTRQQTVSEWETRASSPRRMSQRLLRMVAEEAGVYDAGTPSEEADAARQDGAPQEGGPQRDEHDERDDRGTDT